MQELCTSLLGFMEKKNDIYCFSISLKSCSFKEELFTRGQHLYHGIVFSMLDFSLFDRPRFEMEGVYGWLHGIVLASQRTAVCHALVL